MNFIAIIPARFASSRLPGKPLADINGKPMVIRVMERAKASSAHRVIVATDHVSVVEIVKQAGGEVCLTRSNHQSGTMRLKEVIDKYNFTDDKIIVNVQVDEPLIPSQIIRQVVDNLISSNSSMATLAVPFTTIKEAFNPSVVKVVVDARSHALYFSRAPIPWDYENFARNCEHSAHCSLLRHIGIYAYRAGFIRRYASWSTSLIEKIEMLEQLRVLWYGEKIYVTVTRVELGTSVNTPEELAQIRLLHLK